jgi:hypothetical protein
VIPQSLLKDYQTQDQLLEQYGGILPNAIGIYGQPSGGKTELALTAPGVILGITIDRGYLGLMLNPNPPATRSKSVVWKVINPPLAGTAAVPEYVSYWAKIRDEAYSAVKRPEIRTVLCDGDSDSWEVQRLAEFGQLSQVPSYKYTAVNAARKAYYTRLTDSGKFLIFTTKMTKEYVTVYGPDGQPQMKDGKPVRQWSGKWEARGFDDIEYHLQLNIYCFLADATYDKDGNLLSGRDYTARIMYCKSNRSLEGMDFNGADCTLPTILREVYPHISLKEWGY